MRRATGHGGELRYGYQVASRLGPWVIEHDGKLFQFSAPLVDPNEAWLVRRPLHLILALGQVEWAWHEVEPVTVGGTVHIKLSRRPDVVGAIPSKDVTQREAS